GLGDLDGFLDLVGLFHAVEDEGDLGVEVGAAGRAGGEILDLEADREVGVAPADEALDGGLGGAEFFVVAGGFQPGDEHFLDLFEDDVLGAVGVDGGVANAVDDLALLVEHVVVLEQTLADGVVLLLDLFLGALDGAVEPGVFELFAVLHRAFHHAGGEVALEEEAHEVVLKREEELGETGVALTRATAAQLAIDAAGFVTLGADDVEAAELAHALAEFDVGAAAGHVGGDGDGTALTGARD